MQKYKCTRPLHKLCYTRYMDASNKPANLFRQVNQGMVLLFLGTALLLFILRYGINGGTSPTPFEFYRTFFAFFILFTLTTMLLTFDFNPLGTFLLLFLSFTALVVIDYSLTDFLTIRLFLCLALQMAVLSRVQWPYNMGITALFSVCSTLLQDLPPFLGENTIAGSLFPIASFEIISFFFLLLFSGILHSLVVKYHDNYHKAKEQIEILNVTITKLTVFSQSLQSYARTAEQQAAKKERFRISREIHDISGYMFTNIIAMMDAIIATGCRSSEKTSELCMLVRSQAHDGLRETRKALHLLRNTEDDREQGIRAIYKIKKIFENTTGVSVDIEAGNLPSTFGDEIDLILFRVVQEGLTNALRHGHATRVRILLWIVDGSVQVIVLDNGTGAKKIIKGIGLAGMEERISLMQGTVQAMNAPEGGFQLTVTIPIGCESQGENVDDPLIIG